MSAYMIDRNHVRFLVHCAEHFLDPCRGRMNGQGFQTLGELGQLLWDENRASIEYRYPDCKGSDNLPGPIGESFVYGEHTPWQRGPIGDSFPLPAIPPQIIKACDCYDYQSCEHPEWRDSRAKEIIDAIRCHAISRLPHYDVCDWGAPEPPGYDPSVGYIGDLIPKGTV